MSGFLFDNTICPNCKGANDLFLETPQQVGLTDVPRILKYRCKHCDSEQTHNRTAKAFEPKRVPLEGWTPCDSADS